METPRSTVLVTGGGGRVGNFVVTALLDRGHKVINLDRRKQRDDRARFVWGDVRDRAQVHAVIEGCDAVCHLAEIPGVRGAPSDDEVFWSNTRAGSVVMQSAADLKIKRIIYASTCQVYGTWGDPPVPPAYFPLDETHPVNPQNAYSQSKVANEGYAHLIHKQTGMPVTIFRLPLVLFVKDVNPKWTGWINSDGDPAPDLETYVHAEDAALAFVTAVESSRPGCETFNIVHDQTFSPIKERLAKHRPTWPQLPPDWPELKAPISTAKAREHLNWSSKWDFREKLNQTLERNKTS